MLYKYPTQWESWLYIHKWFKRDFSTPFNFESDNVSVNKFNDKRYAIFKLVDSFFLFDLFDYQSYPITPEISKALESNNFSEIDTTLLEELKTKTIIL